MSASALRSPRLASICPYQEKLLLLDHQSTSFDEVATVARGHEVGRVIVQGIAINMVGDQGACPSFSLTQGKPIHGILAPVARMRAFPNGLVKDEAIRSHATLTLRKRMARSAKVLVPTSHIKHCTVS